MAYTETKADLEWELWMMDMCGDIPQSLDYCINRRKEIKLKLAEIELATRERALLERSNHE